MPKQAAAPSNYSTKIGYAVRVTGPNAITLWTDPDDEPFGVVTATSSDGMTVTVGVDGETVWAKAGAAGVLATDRSLTAANDGRLAAASVGQWVLGQHIGLQNVSDGGQVPIHLNICRRSSLLEQ